MLGPGVAENFPSPEKNRELTAVLYFLLRTSRARKIQNFRRKNRNLRTLEKIKIKSWSREARYLSVSTE
jgi:hypothetical protein